MEGVGEREGKLPTRESKWEGKEDVYAENDNGK